MVWLWGMDRTPPDVSQGPRLAGLSPALSGADPAYLHLVGKVWAALVACVGLMVMAGSVPAQSALDAEIAYQIAVQTDAVDGISRDTILAASRLEALKPEGPISPFALVERAAADRDRIDQLFRAFGYYDATITITAGEIGFDGLTATERLAGLATADQPVDITIAIDPGPLYRVGTLDIIDARFGSADLTVPIDRDLLGLRVGDAGIASQVQVVAARLIAQMRAQAHPFADVPILDATVDHERQTLDLIYVIEPGPAAVLGPIHYDGLETVARDLLEGRVPFRFGDPYDPAVLAEWRIALADLGLFSAIRIDEATALDPAGRLPLTVTVTERPMRLIGAQVGWATDLGAEAEVSWQHRNLLGAGELFSIRGVLGRIGEADLDHLDYRAEASLALPDIGRPYQSLTLTSSVLRESPDAFSRRAVEAGLTLERPLSAAWTGRVGALFETSEVETDDAETFTLFGLPLSVHLDRRAEPLDPTGGHRLDLGVTPFLSVLGATATFTTIATGGTAYWRVPAEPYPILAARYRFDSIWGAGLSDVPSHRRLFAGGGGSVRGFAFQAAGPREADGDPAGGLSAFELALELRQRLNDQFGVVGFVDAGTVYQDPIPAVGEEPIRLGAGMGVRYYTPIGPLRFDIAAPLNPEREDDAFQIYLSIGQAF